jgi:hypothetical protein
MVPGPVVALMCAPCLMAAFLAPPGTAAHPHTWGNPIGGI